ncbi:MAG: hypothetical protein ACI909_001391 [Planctomycetota bacterium]|jgi:hypothetical protein
MKSGKYRGQLRELNIYEINNVSGGLRFATGTGGIFSPKNLAAAARFSRGLGYLSGAFGVGYTIGTYGYNAYSRYRYNAE